MENEYTCRLDTLTSDRVGLNFELYNFDYITFKTRCLCVSESASYFHSPSKIVAAPGAGSISRPLQQRLQSPVRLPLALYAKRSSTALSGKLDVTADEVKVRKAGVTQMVTYIMTNRDET